MYSEVPENLAPLLVVKLHQLFDKDFRIPLIVVKTLPCHMEISKVSRSEAVFDKPMGGLGGQQIKLPDMSLSRQIFHLLQKCCRSSALTVIRMRDNTSEFRHIVIRIERSTGNDGSIFFHHIEF